MASGVSVKLTGLYQRIQQSASEVSTSAGGASGSNKCFAHAIKISHTACTIPNCPVVVQLMISRSICCPVVLEAHGQYQMNYPLGSKFYYYCITAVCLKSIEIYRVVVAMHVGSTINHQ